MARAEQELITELQCKAQQDLQSHQTRALASERQENGQQHPQSSGDFPKDFCKAVSGPKTTSSRPVPRAEALRSAKHARAAQWAEFNARRPADTSTCASLEDNAALAEATSGIGTCILKSEPDYVPCQVRPLQSICCAAHCAARKLISQEAFCRQHGGCCH